MNATTQNTHPDIAEDTTEGSAESQTFDEIIQQIVETPMFRWSTTRPTPQRFPC